MTALATPPVFTRTPKAEAYIDEALQPAEPTAEGRVRFTVDQYMAMFEDGTLPRGGHRFELLDGEIYEEMSHNPPHAGTTSRVSYTLFRRYGDVAMVRTQMPAELSTTSLPEPDLALVKLRDDFYTSRHPQPEDILLLVEVADTSLGKDRGIKLDLYAKLGVREYWIVDVTARAVEVYREPGAEGYGSHQRLTGDAAIAPGAFPEVAVTLSELLG